MKIHILSDGEIAYLNGLLAAFDDLSDGAWIGACQEAISKDPMFVGHDPYDVWLAWVEATSEDGEVRPEP